jgi:hypothetical protein
MAEFKKLQTGLSNFINREKIGLYDFLTGDQTRGCILKPRFVGLARESAVTGWHWDSWRAVPFASVAYTGPSHCYN